MTRDDFPLKQKILELIYNAPRKISPIALEKQLHEKFFLNRREVKAVIKDLVSAEFLGYSYEFGSTYFERPLDKPTRISPKIILASPQRSYTPEPGEISIKILRGASFGSGAHATTRLCLNGIEIALSNPEKRVGPKGCLDIGTGSGILVIAAVMLGLQHGIGIDIDPNALAEAEFNASLNDLGHCIRIDNISLPILTDRYFLITANLRYPTLTGIAAEIARLSERKGMVVLSGFRPNEEKDIEDVYRRAGFEVIHRMTEIDWGCLILKNQAAETEFPFRPV